MVKTRFSLACESITSTPFLSENHGDFIWKELILQNKWCLMNPNNVANLF